MPELLTRGENPFVYATLALLGLTLAISLERIFTLWLRFRLRARPFRRSIEQALHEGDINLALRLTAAQPSHPLCLAVRAGLARADGTDRDVARAMEVSALESMPRITGWTSLLSVFGNVATLLGLTGTVVGMMQAFDGLHAADTGQKQEVLARGIGFALQSTACGLAVAIPATLLAALFHHRQERLLDELEAMSLVVPQALQQAAREGTRRAAPPAR